MEHGWIFRILLVAILQFGGLDGKPPSHAIEKVLSPYLLPDEHPIKNDLDILFSTSRVIKDMHSLIMAGFNKTCPRKFTKMIVTKHPAFPGYVFKLYLDSQRYHKNMPEYHYWHLRVQGAEKIRQTIADRELNHYFKVPKKWIYQLPRSNSPIEGYFTKYYILVEEDMALLSNKENEDLWASDSISYDFLDGLYGLIKDIGLKDCAKPSNVAFSSDGRAAFIDTETFGSHHIDYLNLSHYLCPLNQMYWTHIAK